MPKLSFTTEDGEELKYGLDVAKVTVGRSEENLLVITDASLSGLHAELLEENGNYRLTDLDSTNGTKVNGSRIKDALLQDGDSVQLGNLLGVYSSETPKSEAPTSELTSSSSGNDTAAAGEPEADPWADDVAPAATSEPSPSASSAHGGITSAGRAGFGPKKKKKDLISSLLMTLAIVSLLACAVAAVLASQMRA